MKRALVLGGGGPVGIAWETAILAGLLEGWMDVRAADLIVGTSAGSVVGTYVAGGSDPRELDRMQAERREPPADVMPRNPAGAMAVFQLWSSFAEMTQENRAAVGTLALKADTVPEERWLHGFAQNGWQRWPDTPLLITAVECETGAFRAFSREDGVPIERAVAASCAVPGLFPPVTIDGRRYTDGGVRSGTSADLAARIKPDRVLIVAPMGGAGGGIGVIAGRQIEREVGELEAQGASTRVIKLDEAARAAASNLMDPDAMAPAAAAGTAHGARIADELCAWWGGG